MSDRPIIFSAPMVRALLDGRKTQTRRVIKPQPEPFETAPGQMCEVAAVMVDRESVPRLCLGRVITTQKLPYAPGDRLWVREAHALVPYTAYLHSEGVEMTAHAGTYEAAIYREGFDRAQGGIRWRPSIHMPRWAARLTLTVTDVRVQRLQEISETDALAEGVEMESADPPFYYVPGIWPHSLTAVGVEEPGGRHAARAFAKLWNSLHGPDAWDANPWVVALTFSVERRNIDAVTS